MKSKKEILEGEISVKQRELIDSDPMMQQFIEDAMEEYATQRCAAQWHELQSTVRRTISERGINGIKKLATAEEVLKSVLDPKILIVNKPDYTFNKIIEAMEDYANIKENGILKLINEKKNLKVELVKTKTAVEFILSDIEGRFGKSVWATNTHFSFDGWIKKIEEYAELQTDLIHDLFNNPCIELKPLEDLWRAENPSEHYTIPDRTMFYAWIREKVLPTKEEQDFTYKTVTTSGGAITINLPPMPKIDHTFWNRLLSFITNVQVNDAMSMEEKEYIIRVAKSNK